MHAHFCARTRLHTHTDIRTYTHTHTLYTHTHARTHARTHACTHARTRGRADAQTRRRADAQTRRRADTQTRRHSDTQTYRHTDTQTHSHTVTQTHKYTPTCEMCGLTMHPSLCRWLRYRSQGMGPGLWQKGHIIYPGLAADGFIGSIGFMVGNGSIGFMVGIGFMGCIGSIGRMVGMGSGGEGWGSSQSAPSPLHSENLPHTSDASRRCANSWLIAREGHWKLSAAQHLSPSHCTGTQLHT